MNNKSITLIILQVNNEQKISHIYKSEHNRTRENRVILLILEDKHYVIVKNLNSLLKDKNKCSEHFCINCFKNFRTKSRLENNIKKKVVNHFHNQNLIQFHLFSSLFTLYLHCSK